MNQVKQLKQMRACTIEISIDPISGANIYRALEAATVPHIGGPITTIIDEVCTRDLGKVYAFMEKALVPSYEVHTALMTMEQNDHDIAKFGWAKTFMYTDLKQPAMVQ